jgi:hypothetical protein
MASAELYREKKKCLLPPRDKKHPLGLKFFLLTRQHGAEAGVYKEKKIKKYVLLLDLNKILLTRHHSGEWVYRGKKNEKKMCSLTRD